MYCQLVKNIKTEIMKKLLFTALVGIVFFSACKKDGDSPADSGNIPATGWQIGTTNYTTAFTLKNAGQPNSIAFFDALPTANNLNNVAVLFNNTTGIAAGTFKLVTKPNQSDLLADEIMVSPSTGYSQSSGQYNKQYVSVTGQAVSATVTITSGKAKVVVPSHNIISYPINASSTTTTLAGTLIEQ